MTHSSSPELSAPKSSLAPRPDPSPGHGQPSLTTFSCQSYSVVLFLQADGKIQRASRNAALLLGEAAESLITQPLQKLLDDATFLQLKETQQSLVQRQADDCEPHNTCQDARQGGVSQYIPLRLVSGKPLEGWLSYVEQTWILELEAAPAERPLDRSTAQNLQQFRSQIAQLRQSQTRDKLLRSAARAAQLLTHLERVLIYQFAADDSGTVVAEVHSAADNALAAPSYLGLHFPATDIPEDSRQQYRSGKLRYVPDLLAEPVAFFPAFDPAQAAALPLSQALRSRAVDDCCVTYHSNINVQAFLVVPLIQQGALWGLMVCHHSTPVTLPVAVRLDCAWLGEILSAALAQTESQLALTERDRLKAHQSKLLAAIAQSDDFIEALIHPELRLLGLANAQGAVIFFEEQATPVGAVPPAAFVNELYDWAIAQVDESTYHTDCLPRVYPAAEAYKDIASGLLFLLISSARRYAIAWFRPEVLQTVSWAGNPADSYAPDEAGALHLCPRASFAQWQETVRLTALPWEPWEIESALDLRNALVGVVLRKADEITQMNRELERSNQELAAFAYAASHDLKEPLRGINNYARLLLRENQGKLDEKAVERLNTLTKLSRRMGKLIDALLRFSRIGQAELNLQTFDLNLLVARVVEMQELAWPEHPLDVWIPRSLPTVEADPVLLSEVYNNLLNNALKYNVSESPWVELGHYTPAEAKAEPRLPRQLRAPILYVRDNGIGIHESHWTQVFELFKRLHSQKQYGGGTGAGLTITQKIVQRHGGQIGVFSDSEGTTFYWTLK